MTKQTKYFLCVVAATLLLTACDNIPQEDRLIYVKPAQVQRAILIEDFTGQRCVNCPKATEAIEQLQEQYGDSVVIAVGIHSGPFARTTRGTPLALHTDEGDEYFNYWKVEQQPSGMVNRLRVCDYPDWAAQVYEEIQHTPPVSIDLNCFVNGDGELVIQTQLMARDGNVNGKLQLWLVEDNIVQPQYLPGGGVDNAYVHKHVFRASINGTWGEDFTLTEGDSRLLEREFDLKPDWVIDNLSVVGFVYNTSGVLQATKFKLNNNH